MNLNFMFHKSKLYTIYMYITHFIFRTYTKVNLAIRSEHGYAKLMSDKIGQIQGTTQGSVVKRKKSTVIV